MPTTTQPSAISGKEWQEIVNLPIIREQWGLTDETGEEFSQRVYGAKFDFASGNPGYRGELFILQGDALTGDSPIILTRKNGLLSVENS